MNAALKNLVKRSLYSAGYYKIYRRLKAPSEKRLVILMYHDLITDDTRAQAGSIDGRSPTRSEFEAHLRQIRNNYRVVQLGEAVEEMVSGGLQEDSVAVTFDDGYPSMYTIGFPLLRKYGVPATAFLLTGWINREMIFWWQRVRAMVDRSDFAGVTDAGLSTALGREVHLMNGGTSPDFRMRFLGRIEPILRDMSDGERERVVPVLQRLLVPNQDYVVASEPALTWEQVGEMSDNNVEVAGHTRTHIDVRHADVRTLEREISESKFEIEKQTGRKVKGFAFPYGKHPGEYQHVEIVLKRNGFTYACNSCGGSNSDSSNPYNLWRGSLPRTTSAAIINRDLCLRFLRTSASPHDFAESA